MPKKHCFLITFALINSFICIKIHTSANSTPPATETSSDVIPAPTYSKETIDQARAELLTAIRHSKGNNQQIYAWGQRYPGLVPDFPFPFPNSDQSPLTLAIENAFAPDLVRALLHLRANPNFEIRTGLTVDCPLYSIYCIVAKTDVLWQLQNCEIVFKLLQANGLKPRTGADRDIKIYQELERKLSRC